MLTAILSSSLQAAERSYPVLRAADIASSLSRLETNLSFTIEATVTCMPRPEVIGIADASGAITLSDYHDHRFEGIRAGDRIRAQGHTLRSLASKLPVPYCERIAVLSHGDAPKPIPITAHDFRSGRFDNFYVKVRGVLRDTFVDDIDPNWLHLVVGTDQGSIISSTFFHHDSNPDLTSLIGYEVAVSGICEKQRTDLVAGSRYRLRRLLDISVPDGIKTLKASPTDPFNVPGLSSIEDAAPDSIVAQGWHATDGHVLAVWGKRHMLLRTTGNNIIRCTLKDGLPIPDCGSHIDVVGLPETDLFHINLNRAFWRKCTKEISGTDVEEPPTHITTEQLFTDDGGHPKVQTKFHGHLITIKGLVRSMPIPDNPAKRIYLESGRFTIPADVGAIPNILGIISIGCEIDITGICVTEIDNWAPHSPFPHIREVFLVPRSAADIKVLRHPPWWTPQRLLVVLASLMILLLVILIWNLLLRRIAERRGRQLAEEHIARAETDLKVMERTRLAVELHDSVAQNLTGVAMELETARQFQEGAHHELTNHLNIAWRTLKSCRDELRNCLWDLRSQALEETDMETAIRRTLTPHIKGITLMIRFKVPRAIISDNTTHALLRIIRELVLNGIRHGKATTVRIAGDLEDGALKFSVKDDGCGFDPERCPGVEDGHYGLQGIRERIRQLGGRMSIESGEGKGTKVILEIHMPKEYKS